MPNTYVTKKGELRIYKVSPERDRANKLNFKFKMLSEDYETLLQKQNGVCAICNQPPKSRHLDIDHDHKTRKIRGLLCNRCNLAIGLFDDSVCILDQAINYLNVI